MKLLCKNCRIEFTKPASVARKTKFCSKKCKDDYERDYVSKICKNCKKKFLLPRWELNKGKGSFCSRECFFRFNGESSIETLVRKTLEKSGLDFEQEVQIGKFCVDFLLSTRRIVIECDGEYWHNSQQAKEKDKRKDKFLKARGYYIYRFSEREIKISAEECIRQISLSRSDT